ncbi:MAG TPA: MBL fold metallo-hydrolase [Polyangiaceae bacterium]|jgi:glyoxylase-like metal-dependent hydrolase (beta-lactamase superfamily II)
MKRKHIVLVGLATVTLAAAARAAIGFAPTTHASEPASLGTAIASDAMEKVIDEPGPVTVETVVGADWAVTRAGLIDLHDPKARSAHLEDGDEPIVIQFHALHHPTRGLWLIDTGVERALGTDPAHSAFGGTIAARFMHFEKLKVRTDTATWLASQKEAPAGVLLTHLHLDHVSGMRDVPAATPVFVGPGEARDRTALNWFVRSPTDAALEGKGPLRELAFGPDGVLDLFGDQTVFAIWVPGHTQGSVAFVARTPNGPVLFTGDACHTVWGWKNDVPPGTFSEDVKKSAASLDRLEQLASRHPKMAIRVGHQIFQ